MAGIGVHTEDGSTSIQCLSPRRIIARWFGLLKRAKPRKVEKECKRDKDVGEFGNGSTCTGCSMNGLKGGNSSSSVLDGEGSGWGWKDNSFNLGVGCSLLYLAATSKSELSKMVELRTQMEMLLQKVKEEFKRKDSGFEPFQSHSDYAYTSTGFQEVPTTTSETSVQLHSLPQVSSDSRTVVPYGSVITDSLEQENQSMISDSREQEESQSMISDSHEQEECVEGIDELQAEFEAELERLQLYLDAENSHKHLQRPRAKTADTASTRSCSMSSGEVINPQEENVDIQQGVPPMELERRLHELLEARQQDQIKELETALEAAKQEIREKEIEVAWWKDTAKVISRHVSEPSRLRLNSQHGQTFR